MSISGACEPPPQSPVKIGLSGKWFAWKKLIVHNVIFKQNQSFIYKKKMSTFFQSLTINQSYEILWKSLLQHKMRKIAISYSFLTKKLEILPE